MLIGTKPGQKLRDLVFMDVSGVTPTNAAVVRAYLTLYTAAGSGNSALTITAYALTGGFNEGAGDCTGVVDYILSATWMTRWITPGGDYGRAISGPKLYTLSAYGSFPFQLDLDPSVVQGWISNPGTNSGMLLKSGELTDTSNYVAFVTKDDTLYSVDKKPKLTIIYTIP